MMEGPTFHLVQCWITMSSIGISQLPSLFTAPHVYEWKVLFLVKTPIISYFWGQAESNKFLCERLLELRKWGCYCWSLTESHLMVYHHCESWTQCVTTFPRFKLHNSQTYLIFICSVHLLFKPEGAPPPRQSIRLIIRKRLWQGRRHHGWFGSWGWFRVQTEKGLLVHK